MTRLMLAVAMLCGFAGALGAQQAAAPFFREAWRQTGRMDAATEFQPAGGITPAAVTNANLELKIFDPAAARIPEFRKNPPPGSRARDWGGQSCVQLSGYNQNPPPEKVGAG